jgi:hypothetical protein
MTAVAAPPLGYRAVLRVAGLRSVFVAHAVSMAGSVATEVALSILIFQRTGSALLSALVLVCLFLPYALGGSVLSSIADRFPARRVLVCCDLLCATCVAAMLIPGIPVLALLGLLLVTGIVAPVFQGARAASLAHLLDADTFPVGRSLLRAISQTTVLAGFAIGSVMVAAVGPTWLLAADVTSFLASAVLIGLRSPDTPAHAPDRDRSIRAVLRASTTGLRYVFTNRPLRRLILLFWSVPAFASVVHGLAVAYTAQTNASPTAAGALFTGCAESTSAPVFFEVYIRSNSGNWVWWRDGISDAKSFPPTSGSAWGTATWTLPALPAGYNGISYGLTVGVPSTLPATLTVDGYSITG